MPTSILTLYTENRKELTRFAKFAVVGMIGAVIHFSILNLMHKAVGWPVLWANTLAVSVAILSNFTWNRLWTYPESRSCGRREQLVQFTIVNLIGLVINDFIVDRLSAHLSLVIGDPWDLWLAWLVAVGVVLFWNFGVNRLWTYRGL